VENMSVTLELKPEVEALAVEQAEARGVPVEEYLESVIEENLNEEGKSFAETASLNEWASEFQEWVKSHGYITAPPADDRRESIYREREDSQI
jgi:hypothetical protein